MDALDDVVALSIPSPSTGSGCVLVRNSPLERSRSRDRPHGARSRDHVRVVGVARTDASIARATVRRAVSPDARATPTPTTARPPRSIVIDDDRSIVIDDDRSSPTIIDRDRSIVIDRVTDHYRSIVIDDDRP